MCGLWYFFALAAEVKPLLRRLHFSLADDRGDEHAIAPNDGRGPAATRDIRLPCDIFVGAPAIGKVGVFRDAQRTRSAELRPICGWLSANPRAGQQHEQESDNDQSGSGAVCTWKTETRSGAGIHRRSLVHLRSASKTNDLSASLMQWAPGAPNFLLSTGD